MIERVEERLDVKPKRLIGDTAYGHCVDAGAGQPFFQLIA